MSTKLYIVAGEASGDLHGSNLIKGLKSVQPDCQIRCWGGDLMQNAGGELVRHYKDTAVMGFWEVVKNLGKIRRNIKYCKEDILSYNPDAVILIDYPGFNFRIAEFAHNKGFKVFYYIAPKIWAWKENRGKRLQKFVDKLFAVFPFEIDYFKKRWNIDVIYKGNPLLDSIEQSLQVKESKEDFCKAEGLNFDDRFIALVPGSRRMEIFYLLPRMLDVAAQFPQFKFLITKAPSIPDEYYNKIISDHIAKQKRKGNDLTELLGRIALLRNRTYSAMKHSEAAIISSGTASLEAALIGTPQVVCYAASWLSAKIAEMLVHIKYVSLANLILDKAIFKELLQQYFTTEAAVEELNRLINDTQYRTEMLADYEKVHKLLGGGGASNAVAQAMLDELKK